MKVINLVVDKVIKAVMAVSGIVLLAVTFWQVVCRYVLKAPLPWSQDIIRLSFTYLVFWGAAYCVHEKANLNVDVLLTSLPKVIGKLLEIIIMSYSCYIWDFSSHRQVRPRQRLICRFRCPGII